MADPRYSTSMFTGASHNTFTNSTFVIQSDSKRAEAFNKLQNAVSSSALYSFVGRLKPGKCYPNTRVTLLEGLERWTMGEELPKNLINEGLSVDPGVKIEAQLHNRPIMWLKGGAGSGKSAVAQTFAERCEDLGHIVASFFFFSTDLTRNTAERLFTTLAYQIAQADSTGKARAHIEAVIHQDPHIIDKDFKRQITSLIVDPLIKSAQAVGADGRHRPCTIIIDGLDECTGGEVQAGIVRAICDALHVTGPDMHTMLPRFLICSRPEEPITHAFRSPSIQGMFIAIDLSSSGTAECDIRTFLQGSFASIKKTHPRSDLIPESWPPARNIYTLEYNSSGHFIYADTVMKCVSTDIRPVNALEVILGLRASPQRAREPFAELDVLYHHILSRALEQISIDTIRLVFGFLALEYSPAQKHHPDTLTKLFDLSDGDLDVLFSVTVSLVSVKQSEGVEFRHKSVGDFLHDESRAGKLYIEEDAIYAYIWARCHTMIMGVASLDKNMQGLIVDCLDSCVQEYDFVAERKFYSSHGMTQRQEVSAFLGDYCKRQQGANYRFIVHQWALCCLKYYSSLVNHVRTSKESDTIIQQATGAMISIMDIFLQPEEPWDTGPVMALLASLPGHSGELSWDALNFTTHGLFMRRFLHYISRSGDRSRELLALTGKCFEDERMGDRRLSGERFAEACLLWATRLSNTSLFNAWSEIVLLRQRSLMMNGAARRLQTPFRWRKTKSVVRPYRKTGRTEFLQSHQWFQLDGGLKAAIGLTTQELHFGVRSNLILQKRRHAAPRQGGDSTQLKPAREAAGWTGRRTTVRGYMQVFLHADDRMHLSFLRFGGVDDFQFRHDSEGFWVRGQQEQQKDFALILSTLPAMLAKASKSDAVAALRFKAFPPWARHFPKLAKRARRSMEEYAIRHGYPAVDGYFVDPGIHAPLAVDKQLSQQDTIDVADKVNTNTCVIMIWIWIGYLHLRLVAIFGGLDEIYVVGKIRR